MTLKNDLLKELESNRQQAISGQKLAEKFGVSRNAIWKAITALREDGYEISSRTNSGYQLAGDCNILSPAAVRSYLPAELASIAIFSYKEIDSTNTEAKRLVNEGLNETALILAESQSSGRGRQGRSFFSPRGSSVYLSIVFHPKSGLSEAVSTTTMAAVAVAETIEELTAEHTEIKWVNDVFYRGKKICGILTEAVTDFESGTVASVIVGIGINIGTDFPPELSDIASCLSPEQVNRNQLIATVSSRLLKMANAPQDKAYLQSYRTHSLVLGKKVNYFQNGTSYSGTAIDIDDAGGLIIRLADGSTSTLHSGEISLRLAE